MEDSISVGHWLPDPLESASDTDAARILDEDAAAAEEAETPQPRPLAPSQGPEMPPDSTAPSSGAAGPSLPSDEPSESPPDSPLSSPDYLEPEEIRRQALARQHARWARFKEHRRAAAGIPPETPPEPAGPQVEDLERAGIGMPERVRDTEGRPVPTTHIPEGAGMGFGLLPSPLGDRADGPKGMPPSAREVFGEEDLGAADLGPPEWRGTEERRPPPSSGTIAPGEPLDQGQTVKELLQELREKVEKLQEDEETRHNELLEAIEKMGTVV